MQKWLSGIYFGVRKWRDKHFDGVATFFIKLGITANYVNSFRLSLAFLMFWLVSFNYWLVLLVLLVDFLLDAIDGVIARKTNADSKLGRIFDLSTDDFYVVPLVFGTIWYNLSSPFWAALYLFLMTVDFFLNYIRYSFKEGQFPYSFSKYFVYLSILVMAVRGPNYLDIVYLFWAVVLLIMNTHALIDLYRKNA